MATIYVHPAVCHDIRRVIKLEHETGMAVDAGSDGRAILTQRICDNCLLTAPTNVDQQPVNY